MNVLLSHRGRRLLIIGGGCLFVLILAIAISFSRAPQSDAAAQPHPVTAAGAQGRVVVIVPRGEKAPALSSEAGPLFATLISGRAPQSGATAVVRTDENCTPDAAGISHCINKLAIGDTQLVVQHHHTMAAVPCLGPGETITLITLADYQAQS